MNISIDTLYFVHITDTHIGPTREFRRHGHVTYNCAEQLVDIINHLPTTPDFVIHTGDIVADPDPDSYALAADLFSRLTMPIYYVNGNHDRARDIHQYLPMGPKEFLAESPDVLSYAFEMKGHRFLVLDARGPDEIDPHGLMSEAQLELARHEAAQEGPSLTIFIHFPLLPLNSIWMDAYMLVINGHELHEKLIPARDRLRGVFHGHVHQPMQTMQDGILYVSAPSAFAQFTAWPDDKVTGMDDDSGPGFNFVHLKSRQTIIHQHTFPRPSIT
jgi:Icc protein